MRAQAVVLDVGGVLAHNMWEPMLDDLAQRYRLDRDEMQETGRLLWETFAYVPETPANTWRDMERRYWQIFLRMHEVPLTVEALIELTDRYVIPMPGMRPILEQLRARHTPLVICSNNNEIWWPRQEKALELERFFAPQNIILSSRIGAQGKSAAGDVPRRGRRGGSARLRLLLRRRSRDHRRARAGIRARRAAVPRSGRFRGRAAEARAALAQAYRRRASLSTPLGAGTRGRRYRSTPRFTHPPVARNATR